VPGARPIVAGTEEEAQRLHEELAGLVSLENALRALGRSFNDHNFSVYDPDGAFPLEVAEEGSNRTSRPRCASSIWPIRG
jgi:hypothetical protein